MEQDLSTHPAIQIQITSLSLSKLPSHPLLLILSYLSPLESQLFPLSRSMYNAITNISYFDGNGKCEKRRGSKKQHHTLKHSPDISSLALSSNVSSNDSQTYYLRPFYEIGGLLAELTPSTQAQDALNKATVTNSSSKPASPTPAPLSQSASQSNLSASKPNHTSATADPSNEAQVPIIEGDCGPHLIRYWSYIWYYRSIYKKPLQCLQKYNEDVLRSQILEHRKENMQHASPAFGLISAFIKDDIVGMHLRRHKATQLTHEFLLVTFHIGNVLHMSPKSPMNRRKKGEVTQWTRQVVKCSSQSSGNMARNLVGYPKSYPKYGTSFKTAWCPARSGKKEFLEIEYDFSVYVTKVEIYETYDVGGVTQLKCWNENDSKWHVLWKRDDKSEAVSLSKSRMFSPDFEPTQFQSKRLRIEILNPPGKCCYIDAIRLKGMRQLPKIITPESPQEVSDTAQQSSDSKKVPPTTGAISEAEKKALHKQKHASTDSSQKNSVSIFQDTSNEAFYHPENQVHFEENVRRAIYSNHLPSPMDVCGPLMTYIRSEINGDKQYLTITTTSEDKKRERPLYLWDYCVATRIRMDDKVLCILKRFKGKIAYYISLWDLNQDMEILSHPIEECKSHIDLFELADHMIVFSRKHTVHVYDSLRKVASINPSHSSNSEQWRHVRGLAHESKVVSLSLNSDIGLVSDTLATGCVDGSIWIWSLSRGAILHHIEGFGKSVAKLQLVAAGTLVCATYIHDPRLFIYDCFTGMLYRQPVHLYDRIGWDSLQFSVDSKYLIANPRGQNHCVLYEFDNSDEEVPSKFNRFGPNTRADQSSCSIL
eukprot:CAMPEP_0117440036 /NCGR_PEP_ID=MMETSP0759-20121206/2869_1 /TAXON_ID=63605 /ORGANISM="Percolomonas cosmopolitus, Strain WS" /LENGTH=820 /DNA_ID=CAMNT_0005231761 /DNA_START=334 /DNA_END=2796 /DNA_ORIENTATION=-